MEGHNFSAEDQFRAGLDVGAIAWSLGGVSE